MSDPYRYTLTRTIDPLLAANGPPLLFVMLNPSVADEHKDDPTSTRCTGFARRERAPRWVGVNLYAFRATDPADLARYGWPVGPENDDTLVRFMREPGVRIVCAWGAHPMASKAMPRFNRLHVLAGSPPLWCLGTTKNGAPRHPLYVRGDAPLAAFDVPRHSGGAA